MQFYDRHNCRHSCSRGAVWKHLYKGSNAQPDCRRTHCCNYWDRWLSHWWWPQPLSALHGLESDQVLELKVVTVSGKQLTVNECQNTDLFWALRGVSLF